MSDTGASISFYEQLTKAEQRILQLTEERAKFEQALRTVREQLPKDWALCDYIGVILGEVPADKWTMRAVWEP